MFLLFLQSGPNQLLDDVLMNLYYNANVKENNVTSFCGQWSRRKKIQKILLSTAIIGESWDYPLYWINVVREVYSVMSSK